jgi:hypothetical protein
VIAQVTELAPVVMPVRFTVAVRVPAFSFAL